MDAASRTPTPDVKDVYYVLLGGTHTNAEWVYLNLGAYMHYCMTIRGDSFDDSMYCFTEIAKLDRIWKQVDEYGNVSLLCGIAPRAGTIVSVI